MSCPKIQETSLSRDQIKESMKVKRKDNERPY